MEEEKKSFLWVYLCVAVCYIACIIAYGFVVHNATEAGARI